MSLQCGMSSRCLSKALQKIHSFDALVILASCDNIIAGAYLAAMRLNIPCIVVTGGPMYQGACDGRKIVQAEWILLPSEAMKKFSKWPKNLDALPLVHALLWAQQTPCRFLASRLTWCFPVLRQSLPETVSDFVNDGSRDVYRASWQRRALHQRISLRKNLC